MNNSILKNPVCRNHSVTISGTVTKDIAFSHTAYGENFYETFVAVKRMSEQIDLVPITVSEQILNAYGNIFKGDEIEVIGQFRSVNKLINGRSKLVLSVFTKELIKNPERMNVNEIELIGYVCKPTVYRITPFKREIADVLIAVNRAYHKSDYIPCITWGKNAKFAAGLEVGDKIYAFGRIQSRDYKKRFEDGTEEIRTAYEVSITAIGYYAGDSFGDGDVMTGG